jgi:carbon-monoxide dehydrogenase medium subunit
MNFRCLEPAVIVDLNRLPALDFIRPEGGQEIRIGAMTRYRTLEFDPLVETQAPLIHWAVPFIAHTAIRTRGTVGGSLSYADAAAELPAVTMALGGRYLSASAEGQRWIPAEDFFQGAFGTLLRPDELLLEIAVPVQPSRSTWAFAETARRHGDRVMMGVAAWMSFRADGAVETARLVYMNAAAETFYARQAAGLLSGELPGEELILAAAAAAASEIDPPSDVHGSAAFRRSLAQELTRRVLREAFLRWKNTTQS